MDRTSLPLYSPSPTSLSIPLRDFHGVLLQQPTNDGNMFRNTLSQRYLNESNNQDRLVSLQRPDGWAEVNKRVTTTTLDKAAASNNTVYQELSNTAAEHTSCADEGSNSYSQTFNDGTEEERNEVDQRAEELGQPVDELERADALTLNVEPASDGQVVAANKPVFKSIAIFGNIVQRPHHKITVPVVGQQLQLLHMSKQTLRGNDARTFELIQVRAYYPSPITDTKVMGSEKITLPNESMPVNEPDQIKKIT
ncbi:hypothetical protein Tco_0709276, partial [Tanacetum coccineum]